MKRLIIGLAIMAFVWAVQAQAQEEVKGGRVDTAIAG